MRALIIPMVAEGSTSRVVSLYWPGGMERGQRLTAIFSLVALEGPLPSSCCTSWVAGVATSACRWLMAVGILWKVEAPCGNWNCKLIKFLRPRMFENLNISPSSEVFTDVQYWG